MSVYVLSTCFLKDLNSKVYLTEVLLEFTKLNSYRLGIDKDKFIIDMYHEVAKERAEIASWLTIMSFEPSAFEEIIRVDEALKDTKEIFLAVCKCVVSQRKLIVHTVQNYCDCCFKDNKIIEYDGVNIEIIEKDDAIEEFRDKKRNIYINDSTVATNGSSISGVT